MKRNFLVLLRASLFSLSFMLANVGPTISEAGSNSCGSREATESFGVWLDPGVVLTKASPLRLVSPSQYGLSEIGSWRLQFADRTSGALWSITVRDAVGRPLAVIRPDGSWRNAQAWTERLLTSSLAVEVDGLADGDAIAITGATAYPKDGGDVLLFSIKGATPDWIDPYKSGSAEIRSNADAVAMMLTLGIGLNGAAENWSCSGVLLKGNLLLTNWHCGGQEFRRQSNFWDDEIVGNCILDFRWDGGKTPSQFKCGRVVAGNPDLDFALIEVAQLAGGSSLATLPAPATVAKTAHLSPVYMVHHARAQTKLLSRNCQSFADASTAGTSFLHDCDTDPGSSGAPVFDTTTNEIIGLHHLGFERDKNCNVIRKSNGAIRIEHIMATICEVPEMKGKPLCS